MNIDVVEGMENDLDKGSYSWSGGGLFIAALGVVTGTHRAHHDTILYGNYIIEHLTMGSIHAGEL